MDHPGAAPPPAPPSQTASSGDRHAGGPPRVVERVVQVLQDLHLSPSWLERALSWWTRFGGRRAAVLTLAVTLPLVRYEYLPYVLSTTVETLAEGYGLDLAVGEWDTSLSDIKIVGKDVTITTRGPYREQRLFRAHRVEFDWSLWRAATGGLARLRGCWTSAFGRPCPLPEDVFHRITVDGASLHFERSLAGAWNAEDAVHVESLDRLTDRVARWRIPVIEGRDVSVSWVEHLPGDSGGGLVEERTSSLDFTKVTIGVTDLQVPVDDRSNGSRVTFDGQTADGQVSIAGVVNLSRWSAGAWAPSYDLTFRLVNVGAATFGRFAAPDATLVPKAGRVDGEIVMARSGPTLEKCRIAVRLRDVEYAPNPRSPFALAGGPAFAAQVQQVRVSDVVARDCSVIGNDHREARASQTLQTLVTTGALETAPPVVRGAAGYDQAAVVDGRVPTPAELRTQVTRQLTLDLGQAIAGDRGAAVMQALTTPSAAAPAGGSQGGNVVTRGVKGIGRGIKRLFGGGKAPATSTTTRKPPAP